jgi:hypothetical protein
MDPLEALLQEALAEASRRKVKPMPTKGRQSEKDRISKIKEAFKSTFTNPDRWTAGSIIALIHRAANGHQTLLGAFQEFLHRTGARKLCRCAGPALIEREEYVEGDWWLHDRVKQVIETKEKWETHRLRFDIELPDLQVHALDVEIEVKSKDQWLAEACLVSQTAFVSPEGKQFIYFPAGLDILEGMTLSDKVRLQSQLRGSQAQMELPL